MIIEVWRSVVKPLLQEYAWQKVKALTLWMYRVHKPLGQKQWWWVRLADRINYHSMVWFGTHPWSRLTFGQFQNTLYSISNYAYPWGLGPHWQIMYRTPKCSCGTISQSEVLPRSTYFCYNDYDGYRGFKFALLGYGLTVERWGDPTPRNWRDYNPEYLCPMEWRTHALVHTHITGVIPGCLVCDWDAHKATNLKTA